MRKNPAAMAAKTAPAPRANPALLDHLPASGPDGPPFTPEELSEHLWARWRIQRSPRRLAQLRMSGDGPPYVRDGLAVRYPHRLADQWAAERFGRPIRSTAEEAARYPNNFATNNTRARMGRALLGGARDDE